MLCESRSHVYAMLCYAMLRRETVCMYVCIIDKKSLDFARLTSLGQRR
jgi:hypothetical protein